MRSGRTTVSESFLARLLSGSAGEIGFGRVHRDLLELGLAGECFGYIQYAEALAQKLGYDIHIEFAATLSHPLVRARMDAAGLIAGLFVIVEERSAYVVIPDHLPQEAVTASAYHELAHLALSHHLDPVHVIGGDGEKARTKSDFEERSMEDQAHRYARFLMIAADFGERVYELDWLFLDLEDSRDKEKGIAP